MIVQNQENTSGMFSKAGKLSVEMFSLLQERDQVLYGKNKRLEKLELLQQEHIEKLKRIKSETQLQNKPKPSISIKKKIVEPIQSTTSREYLDKLDRQKINNQKFLVYNPKFKMVFEKSPLYEDEENIVQLRKKNKERYKLNQKMMQTAQLELKQKEQEMKDETSQSLTKINMHSQSLTTFNAKGVLKFDGQKSRQPIFGDYQPHEKRFEYFDFPQISTKVPYLRKVDFDKQTQRKQVFKDNEFGVQYDPNYNFVKNRTDYMIRNFSKYPDRKPQLVPVYTMDESVADYSSLVNYDSNIKKKINVPNFSKMITRDQVSLNRSKDSILMTQLQISKLKNSHNNKSIEQIDAHNIEDGKLFLSNSIQN